LSLVIHPKTNGTTVHANWRYFEMYDDNGNVIQQWFGGGRFNPYYLFEEDAIHFHQTCKTTCDKHNLEFYQNTRNNVMPIYWNAHRNEARGGGLFSIIAKQQMTCQCKSLTL
jgi:coproporphyrinogen III oxidase